MRNLLAPLFAFPILGCILLTGCSKPAVKQTSIYGEARFIDSWRVTWDGEAQAQAEQDSSRVEIDLSEYQSKYTVADHCLEYVETIRKALTSKHDIKLLENVPVVGTIEIKLYGKKIRSWGMSTPDAEKFSQELAEEHQYGYSAVEDDYNYRSLSVGWGKGDVVSRVDIKILDNNGKVLGEVFIGGDIDDKVKPDYVADAIARILK
ncbi:MAG: hypothetical protein JSU65_12135 [Candidatus Zixiibacteriota bacterium]|nr:MAG: hypothetical protein JSU65_12135 [candidate division Zixibacteria bacterium]